MDTAAMMSPTFSMVGLGIATMDPGTDTDTLTRPVEEESFEPGDHERFAHYVRKGQDLEAMMNGTPVVALCGKKWIPSRDPKKFPVCPMCKEIYSSMPPGKPDRGDADA
jgi:hypothetical protein